MPDCLPANFAERLRRDLGPEAAQLRDVLGSIRRRSLPDKIRLTATAISFFFAVLLVALGVMSLPGCAQLPVLSVLLLAELCWLRAICRRRGVSILTGKPIGERRRGFVFRWFRGNPGLTTELSPATAPEVRRNEGTPAK